MTYRDIERTNQLVAGQLYIAINAFVIHVGGDATNRRQILIGDVMIFLYTRDYSNYSFDVFLTKHGLMGRTTYSGIQDWLRPADSKLIKRKK